jgi:hypothetical protein
MVWLSLGSAFEPAAASDVPADSITSTPGDGGEGLPVEPGGPSDNLPFDPTGEQLGSIAWRTWIYTDTGPRRTRLGYLRAGAVVDRRGPEIRNDGCPGGWYRINPRGFVCVGKGATLDLDHPTLRASQVRPRRGQGLPYAYALSRESAPYLYFKLPSRREMEAAEGGYRTRAAEWLGRERARDSDFVRAAPPPYLVPGEPLVQPYGVSRGLHIGAHADRASSESGFALLDAFEWEGRAMALTTELDVIALDHTKLVTESTFAGVALGPDEDLPVAIVDVPWVTRYERDEQGRFHSVGSLRKRTVLALTGQTYGHGSGRYYETRDGFWVVRFGLMLIEQRTSYPSVATGTRKWIDVSIRKQTLVAYTGRKAEYVTLVSTGRGGLGDPEEVPATIQGTFMIHSKHISSTMDGEDDVSDSFNLRDVPFVQYFHRGFALHAAYWHDDFGRMRSHGCINLSPRDAAWLFEWTDPHVPEGWHAALNLERGTVVIVRP